MGSTIITKSGDADVIDITLVLDTSIYAAGDVLVIPQVVHGVFRETGDVRVLHSITILDEDDQAAALDLIFFNADATLGTINAAVSITDADARKIIGAIKVAAADYIDLVNSQVAIKTSVGMVLRATTASASLWIGAVSRGTGTYTAAGVKVKLGFI